MAIYSPEVQVTNVPDVSVPGGVNVNNFPATQPVSGSVSISNFPATQPISGTVTVDNPGLTDTQLRATPVSVVIGSASSSTVTLVVTTGSNQTLLAANPNRKKAILYVETGTQFIKLGAVASASSYTYKAANATLIEIPSEWKGQIDSIGTSGKNILVTELV